MGNCPRCNAANPEGAKFCPNCGAAITEYDGTFSPNVTSSSSIPFEERHVLGFWNSLFETWKRICFYPKTFFPLVGETSDTTSAFYFFLIMSVIDLMVLFPIVFFFRLMQSPFSHTPQTMGLTLLIGSLSLPFVMILIFLITIPLFFIVVALDHVFLLMVGGAKRGFETTFRARAYSIAPKIFPFIGAFWMCIVMIIGYSKAHQAQYWKVVLALTIEGLVILAGVIFLILTLGLSIFHHFPHNVSMLF